MHMFVWYAPSSVFSQPSRVTGKKVPLICFILYYVQDKANKNDLYKFK